MVKTNKIKELEFDPKELKALSPRTKAILLKHKDRILEPLGGKG